MSLLSYDIIGLSRNWRSQLGIYNSNLTILCEVRGADRSHLNFH